MQIVNLTHQELAAYCNRQINNFFPTKEPEDLRKINFYIEKALPRLSRCISEVRMWEPAKFDVLHSTQYCIFLYYLANSAWRDLGANELSTKLFLLNKALNGIDCFYEINLPEVFFIGHSLGIVLAKAQYSNFFVIYQNSTVGKNHGLAPIISEKVIMYPNTAIIGSSKIAPLTTLSQGVSVINQNTRNNMLVFKGKGNELLFKPSDRNIISDFFRGA
jgi:serine O-acetyltransferase